MNRRNFFARTFGAALAGLVSPLVKPLVKRRFDYGYCHIDGTPTALRSRINPAWVDAGPERNIHFVFHPDAFRVYNLPVGPGTYPLIDDKGNWV